MDSPPPQSPPPTAPISPQPVNALPPPPRASGCGCFGAGCLTLLVVGFLALAGLFAGCWYFFNKSINMFTAATPVDVAVERPSEAEYAAAKGKLEDLRTTLHAQQARTFTFTAAELNALIARHPDFASRKGRTRVAIANSLATVEMSVPLETIDIPWVKRRWFNGSANFGFIYADQGFRFDANWLEANGHRLQSAVFRYAADSFNEGFSRGFEKSVEEAGGGDAWRNIKTMTLDEDKLVIITRGSSESSI